MEHVLIVEDSKLFGSILQKAVETKLSFPVTWVKTYAEAEKLLKENQQFFVALLDLNLPDAPAGEVVDLAISHNIPSIVFTGDLSDEIREVIWSKKVADYVPKEEEQSVEYVISLIDRLHRNQAVKVLVVDDSRLSRKILSDLLTIHHYKIYEAADGVEALEILAEVHDIKMVITDYNMPNMDGFTLTKEIRRKYGRDELSIIGISGLGSNALSARFIKYGANDFINKPFVHEEFYCRITQAIEMIENVTKIRDMSNKDYMTGLYNRRFFFESGGKLYAGSKRKQITVTIALLDVDYFKKINDTYGHDIGDKVLQRLAIILQTRFRETDIVSRFGGEEFCILSTNMDPGCTFRIFDELRESIARTEIKVSGETIRFAVSIGVCTKPLDSLGAMIKQADEMLYKAKKTGRNKVLMDNGFSGKLEN